MKRTYEKPLFAAEMFTLNQCIALDCGDNPSIPKDSLNFGDAINCGWDLGGGYMVFNSGGKVCNMPGESMGFSCYNNPSDDARIFRS